MTPSLLSSSTLKAHYSELSLIIPVQGGGAQCNFSYSFSGFCYSTITPWALLGQQMKSQADFVPALLWAVVRTQLPC